VMGQQVFQPTAVDDPIQEEKVVPVEVVARDRKVDERGQRDGQQGERGAARCQHGQCTGKRLTLHGTVDSSSARCPRDVRWALCASVEGTIDVVLTYGGSEVRRCSWAPARLLRAPPAPPHLRTGVDNDSLRRGRGAFLGRGRRSNFALR